MVIYEPAVVSGYGWRCTYLRCPELGKERNAYALPGHYTVNTSRSARAGAHGLWTRWVGVTPHLPAESRLSLPGWRRAHRRNRTAWGKDHLRIRDARVGLCRQAV